MMHIEQVMIQLKSRPRGFHLVTEELISSLPFLGQFDAGILFLHIQHTSASLTLNENADPDVRLDMETAMNRVVPENQPFRHTCEGPDDMPAHVKGSMMGFSLTIPIQKGRFVLGTWQGVYLCEHRNRGGSRKVFATLMGTKSGT